MCYNINTLTLKGYEIQIDNRRSTYIFTCYKH